MNDDVSLGHRKRVRDKYAMVEIRSLPDYEIIEILLFYTIPRADTKAIAKALLKEFGSIKGVLNASELELATINGLGESSKFFFKIIRDLFSRALLPLKTKQNILSNWTSVISFCKFTMGSSTAEEFRILLLNKKFALLSDEIFAEGTVDKVSVFPREVAKLALEKGALSVIIVHNHPSGDVSPSKEDIEVTKLIAAALKAIDVELLDHIIIAQDDHFSFKANMLI